ncbi:hypothetical protein [Achromobacter deleyi]|jgi:hypothetical protein|uniref:hypothetical protein n=1 Tax=Achromobacter deleyi TaxID=1353891 RepID=UPI001490C840|nr:hypothetical protein [Achromobacter deleyi]QVQ29486.1 hypothetical protein HLG70_14255 [Achromobacter deleyi]UIP19608.1 hypothetical protein LYZ39_21865 [Achromobacter deleyi]
MNTADFSVLSDELVVSLNPVRRGVHRARAFCSRLAGLAMPWDASAAGVPSRHRVRSGSTPARWPFPPAPVEDDALTGNAVVAPAAPVAAPLKPAMPAAPAVRDHCLGDATVEPVSNQVTMKAMVTDVVLVLAWGAMIPGLMWLGVAGGF